MSFIRKDNSLPRLVLNGLLLGTPVNTLIFDFFSLSESSTEYRKKQSLVSNKCLIGLKVLGDWILLKSSLKSSGGRVIFIICDEFIFSINCVVIF